MLSVPIRISHILTKESHGWQICPEQEVGLGLLFYDSSLNLMTILRLAYWRSAVVPKKFPCGSVTWRRGLNFHKFSRNAALLSSETQYNKELQQKYFSTEPHLLPLHACMHTFPCHYPMLLKQVFHINSLHPPVFTLQPCLSFSISTSDFSLSQHHLSSLWINPLGVKIIYIKYRNLTLKKKKTCTNLTVDTSDSNMHWIWQLEVNAVLGLMFENFLIFMT